jgi:hypothetical protein
MHLVRFLPEEHHGWTNVTAAPSRTENECAEGEVIRSNRRMLASSAPLVNGARSELLARNSGLQAVRIAWELKWLLWWLDSFLGNIPKWKRGLDNLHLSRLWTFQHSSGLE